MSVPLNPNLPPVEVPVYNLSLALPHVQVVINGLVKEPWREADPVLAALRAQVAQQDQLRAEAVQRPGPAVDG